MRTFQERMETKMDVNQEKMVNRQEKMKAQAASFASQISANQEELKAMLNACLEKMEANPGELHSIAVHQKLCKEEAAVETIEAMEDRYGDWHLAVGCHQEPKKGTQGDGGSQKNLATAHR
jgi:N-acetylglutamate synthase-like GNAT family acetyltransferase